MYTSGGDHSRVIKVVVLILLVVSIIANGIQGYFLWQQIKTSRGLEAIINAKSNCDKCPEQVEATPEPTPEATPTKSRGGSDSNTPADTVATPDGVIEPPRPPAD